MLTLGSTFAGIGGFDLAAERVGYDVRWQSEIATNSVSVLRRHFPDVQQLGDITLLNGDNTPHVDVLVGGTPCQNLSNFGDRSGVHGKKSRLFWDFVRLAGEVKPRYVVWENVAGAIHSNGGRDFAAIIGAFQNIGAHDIAWRVLDAQYFGVPQQRRRVFIIADFAGERASEILFEPESLERDGTPRKKIWDKIAPSSQDDRGQYLPRIAHTLTASTSRRDVRGNDNFIPTWSGATTQNDGLRRLTPLEGERLQGFPDNWTALTSEGKPISDTQRYVMIGNAVAVPVAQWLLGRIMEL